MTNDKHIGQLIKGLRRQRNMTGEELGKRVGLSQSKISKIEIGFYEQLHLKEVDAILNILDAPKTIRQHIYKLMDRAQLSTPGIRPYRLQYRSEYYELQLKTLYLRMYVINSIPALLQTADYRLASLKRYGVTQEETKLKMKAALKWQDLLWDTKHTFHIILLQAALYTLLLPASRHIAQLDRIERLIDLPNVKIGIIPVEAGLPLPENGLFVLYDENVLIKPMADYEIESIDPDDIALHLKIFRELDRLAYYNDEAKAYIRKAMAHFS